MDASSHDLEQSRELVYRAIDAVNDELPPEQQISKAPATVLFDQGGILDSLGFIELVFRIQEVVLAELNLPIAVADNSVLESTSSPFRTVESLIRHLAGILAKEQVA
jgi:acyl carrier protein